MKNKNIYESKCGGFFLTPATGTRLNSKAFSKIRSSNKEYSEFATKILTDIEFQPLAKLLNVIHDRELSKGFVLEFYDAFNKENSDESLFKRKNPINLTITKSVKTTLIRSYQNA